MSLRDVIANAVAPVVRNLAKELGDKVTIARAGKVRQKDGSQKLTWAAVTGLIEIYATVEEVSSAKAQEAWGTATETTAMATVPSGIVILRDDALAVRSGPFNGRQFTVDDLQYDPFTRSYLLALREFPAPVTITGG